MFANNWIRYKNKKKIRNILNEKNEYSHKWFLTKERRTYGHDLWQKLHRNECIPVWYEFIPERNEFVPNRNEIIPDRYWNLGSWIVLKNKTFYVGKGSGSIIFNFQATATVERNKGELCLLKVLCGMNSFQSGMNSF